MTSFCAPLSPPFISIHGAATRHVVRVSDGKALSDANYGTELLLSQFCARASPTVPLWGFARIATAADVLTSARATRETSEAERLQNDRI